MRVIFNITIIILLSILGTCRIQTNEPLFRKLEPDQTGIRFENTLEYTEQLNPYTFKNFYNGGGVAVGDLNNDGLSDLFFCGNMVPNKVYLNKGALQFEDITAKTHLACDSVWSSGVCMIDINADGFLDIYVCKSGPPGGINRHNELFINNGDLTFSESSTQYGLNITGLSVQATFFDYDKDGDLDCYLLNNSITSIGAFEIVKDKRLQPDSLGANKLLRNDNGFFEDVTMTSGIYSSEIGFGLGATVCDINSDNWPDLYISNDFFEKDYLYINCQDGTFVERLEDYFKEIAQGSMGADLADINNDGYPEFFVTEMLPDRRDRQVSKAVFNSWEQFKYLEELGYYHQFGRNVLQLNNGDGTFSEIGRFAGVEATDWSWASLMLDVDNDGWKDIFVSNGIYKDLLDLDYLNFMADRVKVRNIIQSTENSIKSMIDRMPSEPIPNYIFHNNGDLTFTDKTLQWGMDEATFSNGSSYGDLDNDGDLDIVVNNVNMPAAIYENRSREIGPQHNYITLILEGSQKNPSAVGAKISLFVEGQTLTQSQNPVRGFQSSVDHKLLFGVGNHQTIDSIKVLWPDNRVTTLREVQTNQMLLINQAQAKAQEVLPTTATPTIFEAYQNPTLNFTHKEKPYADFNRERLLFHMNSTEGPCICKADVNNDGLDDLYIGGAHKQSATLFLQNDAGSFSATQVGFVKDDWSEDIACAFFDANGDGNTDLYVASGTSEFDLYSPWLNDRLYFGSGDGRFTKSTQRLPFKGFESTSTVVPWDFDKDGDLDLFVGGRSVPFYYGIPADSYLIENDGEGHFTLVENETGNAFKKLGLVTDATLADLDGDGMDELIVVGRWMPIKVFGFDDGKIQDKSQSWGVEDSHGWYNTIEASDANDDGRMDLVVGNHGLNSRFHASKDEPLELWVADFDNNGYFDQIISMYSGGKRYPFAQLRELAQQIPLVANRFSSFNDYKNKELQAVLPEEALRKSLKLSTCQLASGLMINNGQQLSFEPLPMRAQLSPVYAIKIYDFNDDGIEDILLGGNFTESKPEIGWYEASFGTVLQGVGDGTYDFVPNAEAGLKVEGNIRGIISIKIGNKDVLVFTRNNERVFAVAYANRQ
jgi:hypothetical protein